MTVCVIGLGYVGITLSAVLAEANQKVVGVDVKKEIVDKLKRGEPHIHEPRLEVLLRKHINRNLTISDKIPADPKIDTYFIAVATPVNEKKIPVNDYIVRAAESIADNLKKGDLVILRSTVLVGTTRNIVKPVLEKKGLKAGTDFHLVFAPERTAEGRAIEELTELPQIIGGINDESVSKAVDLFTKLTNSTIRVSSLEAAEAIKLFNNVYRDVNIALGNEFGHICEGIGLDAHEVIRAANIGYKRSNIMAPGAGVGGGCLTKDSYILLNSLKQQPEKSIIKLSREINEQMPYHVLKLVREGFANAKKSIKGARILLCGFAFKGHPETNDTRHSPAEIICRELLKEGAAVYGHDFVVPAGEISKFGATPATLESPEPSGLDCITFMNDHKGYANLDIGKLSKRMKPKGIIVDGWRILKPKEVAEFNLIYRGVGVGSR